MWQSDVSQTNGSLLDLSTWSSCVWRSKPVYYHNFKRFKPRASALPWTCCSTLASHFPVRNAGSSPIQCDWRVSTISKTDSRDSLWYPPNSSFITLTYLLLIYFLDQLSLLTNNTFRVKIFHWRQFDYASGKLSGLVGCFWRGSWTGWEQWPL